MSIEQHLGGRLGSAPGCLRLSELGYAEIEHLYKAPFLHQMAVLDEHDVFGLDVAMHDALCMCGGQRIRNLHGDA